VIDMILKEKRKICLVVMDAGVTTNPGKRFDFLTKKLQAYAANVLNGGLAKEFPRKKPADFCIQVVCVEKPTKEMLAITDVGDRMNRLKVAFENWDPSKQTVKSKSNSARRSPKPTKTRPSKTPVSRGPSRGPMALDQEPAALSHFWLLRKERRLKQPDSKSETFAKAFGHIFLVSLTVAEQIEFVIGAGYTADGTQIKSLPFHERDVDGNGVDVAAVMRARAAARKMPSNRKFWFVVYSTKRHLENVRSLVELEKLYPAIVIEAWQRGANIATTVAQIFTRRSGKKPFKKLQAPRSVGCVPFDAFTGAWTQIPGMFEPGRQ
jgi:hypothetical protein